MIEGIDVSYYQGQISWSKVAAAGKRFAIIRSGDGTFLDPMFETYLEGAKAAGLYVDIYHYLRFGLTPEQHAEICTTRREIATRYNSKVRLWLDWEDTSNAAKAMTVTDRVDWALKLMDSIHCPIGHYSAAWWWNPYMGNCDLGGPHWVAHYKTGGSPTLPSGWNGWQVWQYGSSGAVDGIEGNVDADVAQDGFFDLKGGDMTLSQIDENWVKATIADMIKKAGPKLIRISGQDEIMELRADGLFHIDGETYTRLGYDKLPVEVVAKDDPILKRRVSYPAGVPAEMH